MGKGGKAGEGAPRTVTQEEVQQHNKRDDKWLLIQGKAYDITSFASRHPGGAKIISHYAGEDATVYFRCKLIDTI
jgi:cytochrome b involved in lipid metabolism